MNKGTKVGLFVVAFFILLGIAGRTDYTEEVLSEMTEETYNEIKDTLHGASDYEIAKYYMKHKGDYDSVNISAELP